jgi:aldehyde dehydrogenase (NAD+)
MGREVAPRVAARFGRTLLELGGNNGMVSRPSAELELAERAITFAAVGHGGPALHDAAPPVRPRGHLRPAGAAPEADLGEVPVGNPLQDGVLVGPLIDGPRFDAMQAALEQARAEGRRRLGRRAAVRRARPDAHYVRPALVEMPEQTRSRFGKPSRRSST